jgi:putative ABC transport system substrate-binding protein
MKRRGFIAIVGAVAASPHAGWAQPAKVRRVGLLMGFGESDPNAQALVAAFRAELDRLQWKEGRNLQLDLRWGAGNPEKIRAFAKELIDLRPDLIVGQTTPVLNALAKETQTIPIVFAVVSDPVGGGHAATLAHPGGHITGFTDVQANMGGKYVSLLKEIAPRTLRAALLFNPATAPPLKFYIAAIESAASSVGIEANAAPIRDKDEIEGVIATQKQGSGGSVIVMPDGHNTTNRDLIIGLAARYGVPAIYFNSYFAKSGGLIAYGADYAELFRETAGYVDRILRGENPGNLPIQLPAKFELVLNLKTAKGLGLEVPRALLLAADEVIE